MSKSQRKFNEQNFRKFLDDNVDTLLLGRMVELDAFYTYLTGKPTWWKNSFYYATKGYKEWLEPKYETIKATLKPWYDRWANERGLTAYWGAPGTFGIGFLRMERRVEDKK